MHWIIDYILINKCVAPLSAIHSFWREGSWGQEISDVPKVKWFARSFCNQLYQRLINSVIPVYLALQVYIKWLIPRWNTFPCPSSSHRDMYRIYLQLLRGKYFQTEVIIRRIAKFPMPCKVKNNAKYCKMSPVISCQITPKRKMPVATKCTYSWPLTWVSPCHWTAQVSAPPVVGCALLLHTSR